MGGGSRAGQIEEIRGERQQAFDDHKNMQDLLTLVDEGKCVCAICKHISQRQMVDRLSNSEEERTELLMRGAKSGHVGLVKLLLTLETDKCTLPLPATRNGRRALGEKHRKAIDAVKGRFRCSPCSLDKDNLSFFHHVVLNKHISLFEWWCKSTESGLEESCAVLF